MIDPGACVRLVKAFWPSCWHPHTSTHMLHTHTHTGPVVMSIIIIRWNRTAESTQLYYMVNLPVTHTHTHLLH